MLSEKLSKEQADMLYKPLGEDDSGFSRTLLYRSEDDNTGTLALNEAWFNFDELRTTVRVASGIESSYLDVPSIHDLWSNYDQSVIQLYTGGKDAYFRVTSSDDGLSFYLYSRENAPQIFTIYGINY